MLVGQRDNLFERFVGGFPVNDFDHLIDVDQEINFDFPLSATLHMEMCRFVVVRPKPDRQSRYLKCSHPRYFLSYSIIGHFSRFVDAIVCLALKSRVVSLIIS